MCTFIYFNLIICGEREREGEGEGEGERERDCWSNLYTNKSNVILCKK